jgi:mRNA-degrading endonuclease RelE of RelBE toxin-antitoxin system
MNEREYRVVIHPAAAKQLDKLYRSDRKLFTQFHKHIQELAQTPYPQDRVILDHTDEFDMCRTKVGRSWRLVYAVIGGHTVVLILETVSRESAYKGKELETLRNRIQTFLDMLSKGLEP